MSSTTLPKIFGSSEDAVTLQTIRDVRDSRRLLLANLARVSSEFADNFMQATEPAFVLLADLEIELQHGSETNPLIHSIAMAVVGEYLVLAGRVTDDLHAAIRSALAFQKEAR